MKKFINNFYGSWAKSFATAVLLHLLIVLLFYKINIDRLDAGNDDIIYLKIINADNSDNQKGKKKYFNKYINPQEEKSVLISEKKLVEKPIDDSSFSSSSPDSYIISRTLNDSSAVIDSSFLSNHDFISLKTIILNKLNISEFPESDSARMSGNIKRQLLDYYKILYPTPLSKFKDSPKGGGMISIPIDDIINLFK
ncbi:MAG: hypothetical protein KJ571_04060 [Bacteroidetes bacterium]|nr:hypothetical protein [Bacteroidota bacterium]